MPRLSRSPAHSARRSGSGREVRRQIRRRCVLPLAFVTAFAAGCTSFKGHRFWWDDSKESHVVEGPVGGDVPAIARVSYAPPINAVVPDDPDPDVVPPPLTVRDLETVEYCDIRLEESLRFALANSKVMRSIGAAVLRNPEGVRTRYLTAAQYTDPRFGPEAALAAFDAEFATRMFFENNDRVINNRFFGGGTTEFQQDLNTYQTEIRKRSATGTLFALRNNTLYDANNAPANVFRSAWDTNVEAEVRQPLLQGAGVEFNRIAGPDAVPGVYNGVVIARMNNEISQAEFELALRDFVSDVSNAYWELYFAYRDLDARKKARDQAYEVWQRYQARFEAGGGSGAGTATDRVALAREQYFRFQREVEEALSGRPLPATQSEPGAGALRGNGGVLVAERRLRLLMGWPINDRRLLRPSTDPQEAEILYDWQAIVAEATHRRTELHRQRLIVQRRNRELAAAKNFLNPRLDAIARYRFRGFGNDLLGYDDDARFANAVGNLTEGDFQEWQVGVEFSVPLGRRKGHAAVQNAEVLLARERGILHEQQRRIVHDLSNAIAEKDRAYQAVVTNLDRLTAANVLLESLLVLDRESAGGTDALSINLDRLLDAQRRVAESESEFYRSLAAYEVAIKNVNFEKGSLFDYHEILVADSDASRSSQIARSTPPEPALPPSPSSEPAPRNRAEPTGPTPPVPPAAPVPAAPPAEPPSTDLNTVPSAFGLDGLKHGLADDDPAMSAGITLASDPDDPGSEERSSNFD